MAQELMKDITLYEYEMGTRHVSVRDMRRITYHPFEQALAKLIYWYNMHNDGLSDDQIAEMWQSASFNHDTEQPIQLQISFKE